MKIEQVDRDFASDWNIECMHCSEYDGNYEADLAEAAARHRIQAREQAMNDAMTALKSVQYSPAPYTDGVKAIRDRFLQPGDVV